MNLRNTPTREFDFILFLCAVALTVYGALLIYSGSLTAYGEPSFESLSHPVSRQVLFGIFGVAAMIGLSRIDYRLLGPLSVTLYVLALASLLYVLVAGVDVYGSRRWINIAGTQVQPSEFAKVCTVIMLAKYLSDAGEGVKTFRVFATSLVIALVPALLVLVEPDLGSASVFGALWLGVVLMAGVRWSHLALVFGIAAALTPIAVWELAHGYQRERINAWLNAENDPVGSGFQILQAETSIGSGQFWGKGFTDGTQTQLEFLRTPTTDYIFSVAAEELGFAGAMVLFGLFILLLFRCLRIAGQAQDSFGRMIAAGVMMFILFQVFVNIGVNIRLLPVTGVTLPLISQGGSSLVAVLASLGILQSILGYRRKRVGRI
jgi:rod shape determining protein RodA